MGGTLRGFRNRLATWALGGTRLVLARLSLTQADRLGGALGRLLFAGHRRYRERALAHLQAALGAGPDRRRRIALDSFRLFSSCILEWIVLCGRGREAAVAAVVETEGWEHLLAARENGRGVVMVTAHFGLFELMPVYVMSRGVLGKVVGRRPSDKSFERLVEGNRRRMGVETVPQLQARELLRVLKSGGSLGILPDQDVDRLPGVFVPFFGRPAYTPTGPATLAVTTGAKILPAFLHRLSPGRHRLVIRPAVADPGGERDARIETMTAAYTAVFEDEIAAAPEHWAWFHRRWRTTPERLARRRERRRRRAMDAG